MLSIIGTCFVAAYVLWLDVIVGGRLASLQWELPARVYARATEIYTGAGIGIADLERRLRQSGYAPQPSLQKPGDYRRDDERLFVYLRAFAYWDGVEPARQVRITFSGMRVSALADGTTGRAIDVLRVDPPLVGRIVPRSNESRVYVAETDIPVPLRNAIVAVEDRHFFEHGGIDFGGILRALWVNLRAGEIEQGGSTLTQQLVKNLFLSPERTVVRKVNEAVMAMLVERRLNKRQILWAYVNEVYIGQHGATALHGFGAGAEYYFGRPLDELRVHQMALLVALVRGASLYNPHRHPERARARRDLVLRRMAERGYLEPDGLAWALRQDLDVVDRPTWSRERFPAYMDLVRAELASDYSERELASGGWRIFTALDVDMQEAVDTAIKRALGRIEVSRHMAPGTLEAAAVVVDYSTGEVVALCGGRDAGRGDFNRALAARRPIGSLIKPYIYLTALSDPVHYNLLTPVDDTPLSLPEPGGGRWQPENYDRRSHGEVTLLEALSRSYNLSTVRIGLAVGLDRVIRTLERGGIPHSPRPLPSLLLGAVDLAPIDVAALYQSLANGGFRIPLSVIREAVSAGGRGLSRRELVMAQAHDPAAAYLLGHAMARVTSEGTGRVLARLMGRSGSFPGKTGTTNDLRDSWFAGYGDRYLGVVWVGRDDNRPMGLTGATGAMPVWADMMRRVELEPSSGAPPAGVQWLHGPAIAVEGRCQDPGYIPYIGAPPSDIVPCIPE
jgi:penicillin-binding protein 1B